MVSKQLTTCANALLKKDSIPAAVANALGRTGDLGGVTEDLTAARVSALDEPLTQSNVRAATAALIEYHAGPLTYAICGIAKQALDRAKEWLNEQHLNLRKDQRDNLKDRAALLVRQQLDRDGVLTDRNKLAALKVRPETWAQLVDLIARQLWTGELVLPPDAPPVKVADPSESGPSQPVSDQHQAKSRQRRQTSEQREEWLVGKEGWQRWEEIGHLADRMRRRGELPAKAEDVFSASVEEATLYLLRESGQGEEPDEKRLPGLLVRIVNRRLTDQQAVPLAEFDEELGYVSSPDHAGLIVTMDAIATAAAAAPKWLPQDGSWEAAQARDLLSGLASGTADVDITIEARWWACLEQRWGSSRPDNARSRSKKAAVEQTINLMRAALAAEYGRGGSA
ncbi:hypothetical protein [Nonomuraea sp. NPDC049400]|uniref:hypothetical protein n=1 Tax=Nonomuraea sp. NPDC049400 TaxID=3364352 RepID=UPI00378CEDAB